MSSPSLRRVVRGGLWLYLRSLVNNLSGFIYWMVISRFLTPTFLISKKVLNCWGVERHRR